MSVDKSTNEASVKIDTLYDSNTDTNEVLSDLMKKNSNEVNLIKSIVEKKSKKKLSIVGEYVNLDYPEKNRNDGGMYHGLSPKVDSKVIINAIKQNAFRDSDSFEMYMQSLRSGDIIQITENSPIFSLRKIDSEFCKLDQELTAKAIFAKSLICLSMKFGLKFDITKIAKEVFVFLKKSDIVFGLDYEIKTTPSKNMGKITFKYELRAFGCSLQKVMPLLYTNFEVGENNSLTIKNHKTTILENINMADINIIGLTKCYYSGVMPKVLEIEKSMDNSANGNLQIYNIKFCKTTFSTLDAMDNSYIKNHILLSGAISENTTYREVLDKADVYEDNLKKEYLSEINVSLDQVNKCVKYSLNSNTCAVTCDILTNDGQHIMTRRSADVVDTGTIYPSCNGQSELLDNNVSFYKKSVYEDNPTIDTESDRRIDFSDEVKREAYAELGVEITNNSLEYLGISLLGICPTTEIDANITKGKVEKNEIPFMELRTLVEKRRLHFNIYTKSKSNDSMEEIEKKAESAVENFESDKMFGIKLKIDNKRSDTISRRVSIATNAMSYLDTISVLALSIVILLFSSLGSGAGDISMTVDIITTCISSITATIAIMNLLRDYTKYIIKRNRCMVYYFNFAISKKKYKAKVDKVNKKNMKKDKTANKIDNKRESNISIEEMEKFCDKIVKFFKKHDTKLHPVSALMMIYLLRSSEE